MTDDLCLPWTEQSAFAPHANFFHRKPLLTKVRDYATIVLEVVS